MNITSICKGYVESLRSIVNCRTNDAKTNVLTLVAVLSLLTVFIPVGLSIAYLFGRVKKQTNIDTSNVSSVALNALEKQKTQKTLSQVLEAYNYTYRPNKNRENLEEYAKSKDFERHAETALIYFNGKQLAGSDALRIIFQREPTNIEMQPNLYNKNKLKEQFGYENGIYNDPSATKADGKLFKDLPNSACVYSETFLWNSPGKDAKIEIACLSLPAPALDKTLQPHYKYYVHKGKLDLNKYEEEIQFLFRVIEQALRDNKESAFAGNGIKRLVLSKFGQMNFLKGLKPDEQKKARGLYKKAIENFLDRIKDLNVEIVMSEYFPMQMEGLEDLNVSMMYGDILTKAKTGDLIVNAWDPHSAPGNGNDGDNSFDGAMGKGTGILLTQTAWLNPKLTREEALRETK
jgi:hypothetical protein